MIASAIINCIDCAITIESQLMQRAPPPHWTLPTELKRHQVHALQFNINKACEIALQNQLSVHQSNPIQYNLNLVLI